MTDSNELHDLAEKVDAARAAERAADQGWTAAAEQYGKAKRALGAAEGREAVSLAWAALEEARQGLGRAHTAYRAAEVAWHDLEREWARASKAPRLVHTG